MLSIFTSVASAVVSVVSSIAPVVSKFVPIIEKGVSVIEKVGSIAQTVMQVVGIFKPQETTADIGERALQAAEQDIVPEKFDRYDDYLTEIRRIEPDVVKAEGRSTAEKIVAGLGVAALGLADRFDVSPERVGITWVLAGMNPTFFTAERLTMYLEKIGDMATVAEYFEGKLTPAQAQRIEKDLVEAEKKLGPEKDDNKILEQLDQAAEAMQQKVVR